MKFSSEISVLTLFCGSLCTLGDDNLKDLRLQISARAKIMLKISTKGHINVIHYEDVDIVDTSQGSNSI